MLSSPTERLEVARRTDSVERIDQVQDDNVEYVELGSNSTLPLESADAVRDGRALANAISQSPLGRMNTAHTRGEELQLSVLNAAGVAGQSDAPLATDSSELSVVYALAAETLAGLTGAVVSWGAVKGYSESWIGALLEQQYPDMNAYDRGLLQASYTSPFLALSFFAEVSVIGPGVKSLLGAAVIPNRPEDLYPLPEGATGDEVLQVQKARERLIGTQAAGRIGTFFGDLTALASYGIAYGARSAFGATSTWSSILAAGAAGGAMMLAQSAIALLTRTREGDATHHVGRPPKPGDAIGSQLRNIMVVKTPAGAATESRAWQTRNLVQEVLGVELLASVFGMMLANTYAAALAEKGPASSDAEAFGRGLGGVFCTVGVFFFATLSLASRRGSTDDVFSGTLGALRQLAPWHHGASTQKLFNLDPDGKAAAAANVLDGTYHVYRSLAQLPGHMVLDVLNVLTMPWRPTPPQPTAELIAL